MVATNPTHAKSAANWKKLMPSGFLWLGS